MDGDVVVAERRRGQLVERTCKELKLSNGGYELWPRSSDVKYREPIHVPSIEEGRADDGEEIEIVGLVIGRFSPM